jgi:hypothetical protein
MHIILRPVVYIAILVLTVGFSVLNDVSDMVPRQDQVKVRCEWPGGATTDTPWYVEEVGGAEAERPEGQASGRCVGFPRV